MDSNAQRKKRKEKNTIKQNENHKHNRQKPYMRKLSEEIPIWSYRLAYSLSKPVPTQMIFFRRFFCGICRMRQRFRGRA